MHITNKQAMKLKDDKKALLPEEEVLDFVNEQDEVIGTIFRSDAHAQKKLASLRAVWLLIQRPDKKFWIPRRHALKKILPNSLDGSVCGHVSSGETYEQAMIRETQEELNFDISKMQYRLIGKITPAQGSLSFIQVYELQVSDDFIIDYNKDDFSEFFWLSAEEIIERIESGEPAKTTLAVIMRLLYLI